MPIFQLADIEIPSREAKQKYLQFYDYSKTNIKNFSEELSSKIHQINPSVHFSDFTDLFQTILDKHCKLDKPKSTKRTSQNSPWISDSLIQAIEHKHELKDAWSKTTSKKCPDGNIDLRDKFKKYRSTLNKLIKTSKSNYYTAKITESKDDRKKPGKLLMNCVENNKQS